MARILSAGLAIWWLFLLLLIDESAQSTTNCTSNQFQCQDRCDTVCCGNGCCPSGFICNVADYSCLKYSTAVQSPVVSSSLAPSATSSSNSSAYNAPAASATASVAALALGQRNCNSEADFPGHGAIQGDNVRLGSQQACMNTALAEDEMYDGKAPITYSATLNDVPYYFAISWVRGCKTTVGSASPAQPLNQTSLDTPNHDVVCTDLLYDNWLNCTGNGGVGGYVDAGCLRYNFTPTASP
ncbi:hypothetical protein PG996_011619 [Apiospora saccharicola]|uniref:Uncharacterized protein n=1 Tax=Apiospora saccharicola TaxID=335842 RepID=A0ABR1UG51_9PEZI